MTQAVAKLEALVRGTLLSRRDAFDRPDMDAVLDSRDVGAFDAAWARVNAVVRATQERTPLGREAQNTIDRIREEAYKRTFEMTMNPDVAAYVSDDLGLVAAALAVGLEDEWLNGLWLAYRSGAFPHGDIQGTPGKLDDLL